MAEISGPEKNMGQNYWTKKLKWAERQLRGIWALAGQI